MVASDSPTKRARTSPAAASGAARAGAAAASGAGGAASKSVILDIPETMPLRPKIPSTNDIVTGQAPQLKDYARRLRLSVKSRLSLYLYEHTVVKLRQPLYTLKCPEMTAARGASGLPTSFKEAWHMGNCVKSLRSNGMYEAAMPSWQLEPAIDKFDGHDLIPNGPAWHQYMACLGLWSTAVLTASSQQDDQRRFIFPGFIPTAVGGVGVVEDVAKKAGHFKDLPVCGGHVVFWSLDGALDEALNDDDEVRILRLYEATLSVTVRMRSAPSSTQLTLDHLNTLDTLRMQAVGAGNISYFEFVVAIGQLPGVHKDDGGLSSGPKIVEALSTLGVQYKGKTIDIRFAYTILAVMPFALDEAARGAVRFVERVSATLLSDPTKLMRCCQVLRKVSTPDEWMQTFTFLMEWIGVSLLSGDLAEADYTVEFMAGRARAVGYVHTNVITWKFLKWIFEDQLVTAASGAENCAIAVTAAAEMRKTYSSPLDFYRRFARERKPEEADECSLLALTKDNIHQYVESTFKSDGEKAAATLLANVYAHLFENEFNYMAEHDTSFAGYFSMGGDPESTCLREAFADYKKTLLEVPVPALCAGTQAIVSVPGDQESETKVKLYHKIVNKRKENVVFHHTNCWQGENYKTGGAVTEIFQRSKFLTAKGEAGKHHRLMLLSAELFPSKAAFSSGTAYKERVEYVEEMGAAVKWMATYCSPTTIALVTDGRSRKVRRALEELVEASVADEKLMEGTILYREPASSGDIRFPKRKVFAGLNNRETVLGMLPVGKVRMKSKPRDHFAACGEVTTYATSYSSADFRSLKRLPRMSLSDKEDITGVKAPAYPEEVVKATGTKGHPLFWSEAKTIDLYIALFKDLMVDHIFDLTPGSTAAACAAAVLGVTYEGVAMSEPHANWLNNIMDKTIFTILADSTDDQTKDTRTDINCYFTHIVEEGRLYMMGGAAADADEESDEADDEGDRDDNK